MKKYLQQFNKHLSAYELQIRDVEADGNCLFRAIADQLTGDEDNYEYYRKITTKELQKNDKFYRDFLPEGHDMSSYTSRMSMDGTWGGHLELQALSDALQVNIMVHTIKSQYTIKAKPRKTCCQFFFGKKPEQWIHLAFHSGEKIVNHYSSVRQINDNENQPAKVKYVISTADQSTLEETALQQ